MAQVVGVQVQLVLKEQLFPHLPVAIFKHLQACRPMSHI